MYEVVCYIYIFGKPIFNGLDSVDGTLIDSKCYWSDVFIVFNEIFFLAYEYRVKVVFRESLFTVCLGLRAYLASKYIAY